MGESVSVMFRLIRLLRLQPCLYSTRTMSASTRQDAQCELGDSGDDDGLGWHSEFGRRRIQASRQLRFFRKPPQLLSEVVDQNECIISVETPGHSWVYYIKEIKPESVVIDEQNGKISFAGDNTIVEHTFEGFPKIEKDNKSSITLRGDVQRVKDALKLIFTKYCSRKSG